MPRKAIKDNKDNKDIDDQIQESAMKSDRKTKKVKEVKEVKNNKTSKKLTILVNQPTNDNKEILKPVIEKDFKIKYVDETPQVLDEKGFPTIIPHTELKIVKVKDTCERYHSFDCPELNCEVRVLPYTPENDKYFRKEAFVMSKLYHIGIVPKLYFGIFKKDFIYLVCERHKTNNIYELYGTNVPSHVFTSIRKMLWVMFLEGYEYPEIKPHNFLVTEDNYLLIHNFDHTSMVYNFKQHSMNQFLARFIFAEMDAWNPEYTDINNNREITNEFELQYNYLPKYMKDFTKPMFDKDESIRQQLLDEKKINMWDYYPPTFVVGNDNAYKLKGIFDNVNIPKAPFKNGRFYTEILFGGKPIEEGELETNPITEFLKLVGEMNNGNESNSLKKEIKKLQDMLDAIQNGTYDPKDYESDSDDSDEDSENSTEIEERKRREQQKKEDHEKHIQSQLEIKKQLDDIIAERDRRLAEAEANKETKEKTTEEKITGEKKTTRKVTKPRVTKTMK